MHIDTTSRIAFERLTTGLRRLQDCRRTKNRTDLASAAELIQLAVQEDGDYLPAVFYSGVVADMTGKPADAVPIFQRILNEESNDSNEMRDEVEYNLAVSWYHQYRHEMLAKAETHFLAVLGRTENVRLRALTLAGLAQTYAMWMIPTVPQKRLPLETIRSHVEEYYGRFDGRYKQARALVTEHMAKAGDAWLEVEATAENAAGIASMYRSDYALDAKTKTNMLEKASKHLEESRRLVPFDWKVECNLGSVHMRLASLASEPAKRELEFEKAVSYFLQVVKSLRPQYGFAFYELGRIYRIWGKKEEALCYFDKAKAIDEKYRDVEDPLLALERARADRGDSAFP